MNFNGEIIFIFMNMEIFKWVEKIRCIFEIFEMFVSCKFYNIVGILNDIFFYIWFVKLLLLFIKIFCMMQIVGSYDVGYCFQQKMI